MNVMNKTYTHTLQISLAFLVRSTIVAGPKEQLNPTAAAPASSNSFRNLGIEVPSYVSPLFDGIMLITAGRPATMAINTVYLNLHGLTFEIDYSVTFKAVLIKVEQKMPVCLLFLVPTERTFTAKNCNVGFNSAHCN